MTRFHRIDFRRFAIKLQIVSDLHLEFYKDPEFTGIEPAPDADVLVLAGDIGIRTRALAKFANWPVPVIYLYGNHEMYSGYDLSKTIKEFRNQCAGTQIHFLERNALVLPAFPHVRFLGTCLWTDYAIFGASQSVFAMHECQEALTDHSRIRTSGRRFNPGDARFRSGRSKNWLIDQLAEPFDGKTVVVTHHGCQWESIAPKWRSGPSLVSAGYASDMTEQLEQADLWIDGHTHDSRFYQVGKCRVVVNPRGYPVNYPKRGGYENTEFDPNLVVEVGP